MGGIAELPERGIIRLDGEHRVDFLQGLVSNDVTKLAPDRPLYASLLTAQGKFLHDFLLFAQGDAILIECEAPRREDLLRRLRMYKLRSRIELRDESAAWRVFVAWDEPAPPTLPDGVLCHPDPRHAALGLRLLVPADQVAAALAAFPQPPESIAAYHRHRIALGVPDGSRDMVVEKAILLENGFDALNGVAWDKGCYIGQELTARTKYRGLIKKRLIPVAISGPAPEPGTPVTRDGAEVGEMRGAEGDLGLALLRLECLNPGAEPQSNLHCGAALLTPRPPTWLTLPQAQG